LPWPNVARNAVGIVALPADLEAGLPEHVDEGGRAILATRPAKFRRGGAAGAPHDAGRSVEAVCFSAVIAI
jgi:hypothetical protein